MLFPLLALLPPAYRIVDLGLPPGAKTIRAVAINNRDEVLVQDGFHGRLWREGRFLDLGVPTNSRADSDDILTETLALNDRSAVVGGWVRKGNVLARGLGDSAAFVWQGNDLEMLVDGTNTEAYGVNNDGDVIGCGDRGAFARIEGSVLWLPGVSHAEPHGSVHGKRRVDHEYGRAINDRRQILMDATYGVPHRGGDLSLRSFLVDGDVPTSKPRLLPLPQGFDSSYGIALNNRGTVLALARHHSTGGAAPYLVRRGRVVPLPFGDAINGRDEVVGGSPPAMWQDGRIRRLPPFSGWTLQTATGINDKGAICGTGLHEGRVRTYMLTPFHGFGGRR